jgi:uncharacterized protein DUF6152
MKPRSGIRDPGSVCESRITNHDWRDEEVIFRLSLVGAAFRRPGPARAGPYVTVALVVLCVAARAGAHHSWASDYDAAKPVAVKGVVTKVEWTNPHTHIYIESADAQGTVTSWNFEMASTLALERGGWSRKTLNVGDRVSVEGFGGRAAITRAIVTSITLADGRELFVAKPGN